ncbi:MAG TPA: Xaa-Pro peptidase family protein [Candidatus Limnocylindria bacterium]|nr:Xaa-Pro peptidase family protein [Candidatus Limnocylindria bacterium]
MPGTSETRYQRRRERAIAAFGERGIGALVVGPGSDLAYLAGYRIGTSERLTALVLTADGGSTLVVPGLEAPRARVAAPGLPLREWQETDDPHALVAGLIGPARTPEARVVVIGDQLWAAFLLRLQELLPGQRFRPASEITRGLRARKDPDELAALREVGASADRAYARVRDLEFAGRREDEVGADIARILREEGHEEVTFTIVASGANGASPHHHTGTRTIGKGDAVVLDFGGTRGWYCSDITRTVVVGEPDAELVRVHDLVRRAQEAGYEAAREGAAARDVDAAARAVISEGGYGERFIHRLGHGIGLDGHEHPYLVSSNDERLERGMAFSIEPGIYLPGRFGVRIEDIAAIGADGRAQPFNVADHALARVR